MLARAASAFGDLFARLADDGTLPAVVHAAYSCAAGAGAVAIPREAARR